MGGKKWEKRMGLFPIAFGIDFRPNHLILTLLKKSLGGIRVVDASLHPIAPEEQKEERENQIIGLINGFVLKHRIKKDCVSISIPGEKAIVRFLKLPISTRENLRKVLEYETPRYTPFEREEIVLDYCLLREEKEWLYLAVVYAKRLDIDFCLSMLKKAGIKPLSIQIPSVSALNLYSYHQPMDEHQISILLDVSKPHYEINLIQGRDWRETLRLPMDSGGLKLNPIDLLRRLSLPPDDFTKTTFFVSGLDLDEALLSKIKETRGIKGVSEPPISRLKISGERTSYTRIYPSLGVPLKEMVKTSIDLNLLPIEWRRKKRKIGKALLIVGLAFLIALGLRYGAGVYLNYREELISTTEELKKRKPEVEAIERLQKQREALLKEIAELDQIRSEEVSKIEILKELTRLLPDTAWIWNLKYHGKEIEISGYADSASDLIPLLDKSPFFEKVEFLATVTKERLMRPEGVQEKERFRIKARLEARRGGS